MDLIGSGNQSTSEFFMNGLASSSSAAKHREDNQSLLTTTALNLAGNTSNQDNMIKLRLGIGSTNLTPTGVSSLIPKKQGLRGSNRP